MTFKNVLKCFIGNYFVFIVPLLFHQVLYLVSLINFFIFFLLRCYEFPPFGSNIVGIDDARSRELQVKTIIMIKILLFKVSLSVKNKEINNNHKKSKIK